MKLRYLFKRAAALMVAMSLFGMQIAPLQAAMVGTGELLQLEQGRVDREQLSAFLERDDVRQQLAGLGVDPEQAKQRVAAMTDEEILQLNGHLEELPAGSDLVGLVVLIFVIFIITDMLGATDVFSFVKPINR